MFALSCIPNTSGCSVSGSCWMNARISSSPELADESCGVRYTPDEENVYESFRSLGV